MIVNFEFWCLFKSKDDADWIKTPFGLALKYWSIGFFIYLYQIISLKLIIASINGTENKAVNHFDRLAVRKDNIALYEKKSQSVKGRAWCRQTKEKI